MKRGCCATIRVYKVQGSIHIHSSKIIKQGLQNGKREYCAIVLERKEKKRKMKRKMKRKGEREKNRQIV